MAEDLFTGDAPSTTSDNYSAKDIEVLEGLEPVRKRPGMYIGGSDEVAMHHLVNEVFDNSMDEAVAGHATRIEVILEPDNRLTIKDNGRGIPTDPHPKHPDKSALEVILCTLHAGGKFSNKAYETSGGLHGVGISVVNALSDDLVVEVARNKQLWKQSYSKGLPQEPLQDMGTTPNRRGTSISFHPDPEIFGHKAKFRPSKLFSFVRAKAYLFKGVEIRWSCAPELVEGTDTPAQATLHFPNGIQDFLSETLEKRVAVTSQFFAGDAALEGEGRMEWAIAWPRDEEPLTRSYCNTIPTPDGGTHEAGFRAALLKAVRAYGDMAGYKRMANVTADDVMGAACMVLSIFIREPQFQGQTKDKLVNHDLNKLVEGVTRDRLDIWLSSNPHDAESLLQHVMARMEERMRRKKDRDVGRKSPVQKLRLPGKLADCTRSMAKGTEIFLVEGDSAGGSAKQARNRETQAILPLRGKILNVASATPEKIKANQEVQDIEMALGCGTGKYFKLDQLRYDKIVIMTDADVDGAHIAALLMTYFYLEMPGLIDAGKLYLANPPLFRITQGTQHYYASSDAEREKLLADLAKKKGKIDVGRFKGLGEMTPPQLKSTTMNPASRSLSKVVLDEIDYDNTQTRVEHLMGKKPELRFRFIQEQTENRGESLLQQLDV